MYDPAARELARLYDTQTQKQRGQQRSVFQGSVGCMAVCSFIKLGITLCQLLNPDALQLHGGDSIARSRPIFDVPITYAAASDELL